VALGIATDLVTPVPQEAFEAIEPDLARYLDERLRVSGQGKPCRMEPLVVDYGALPQDLGLPLVFRCPQPVGRLAISYLLFFDIDAQHRGIGKLVTGRGEEEFLFDRSLTALEFDVGAPELRLPWIGQFLRMAWLGVEHILGGYDHLLFLVALVIVQVRFWSLLKIVTAFTVAHSVTLTLAWFGWIDLPARLVESLIAVTIAYVAVENILGKGVQQRWVLTFGLGLVHGLGFYGVLREIELARENVATTLIAFNLGIEAGQIVAMAGLYGALVLVADRAWYALGVRLVSAAILAVSGWWVIERAFLAYSESSAASISRRLSAAAARTRSSASASAAAARAGSAAGSPR
jgi:hypothetical protein